MISRKRQLTSYVDRPASSLFSNMSLSTFHMNEVYGLMHFQDGKERTSRLSLKILRWSEVIALANEEFSRPSLADIVEE
jgi:hypothetical protein